MKTQVSHAANPSSFSLPESALYVSGRPSENLVLVYDNNQAVTAEAYAKWSTDWFYELPLYVRAGRFWVPYGLQIDDISQAAATASYVKGLGFAPNVGFAMTNTASDTGVEVGLEPKKGYFANFSVTNGIPSGGAAQNEAKAWTLRLGFITKHLALGVSGFRNHPLGAGFNEERRAGFFGWTSWWRFALLGEWGIGRDQPNTPSGSARPAKLQRRAGLLELDYEILPDVLLGKFRYDFGNPNTGSSANARRRYSVGVEWFATQNSSVEAQWRRLTEPLDVKNNQGVLAAHVWF
ncbi:MAG: hypothetical protein HY554_14525 [Elusimicrobia bacterium]|nr:hypothetical protein [Elusimicrobiota bacterium]